MNKNKKIVSGLFILFICLLSLTIYTSFSSNIDTQEIVIKGMVPVYDETSTIKVDNNNVVFNDKNQVVKYNVVLENTQDYDVKISDIKLSTPTEEFLKYEVEEVEDKIVKANSTKELTVSFETMGIKGWGRNFNDELIATISFEKLVKQEEVTTPEEDTSKEEDKTTEEENDNKDESSSVDKPSGSKPSTDNKDETTKEDEDNKVENPYTSDKGLVIILSVATAITGVSIIIVSKNKFAKYTVFILMLSPAFTITNAEEVIEVVIKNNVSFESQNTMDVAYEWEEVCYDDDCWEECDCIDYDEDTGECCEEECWEECDKVCDEEQVFKYFWGYNVEIKNIYIQNEISEINDYAYKFDVSEKQNNRVVAYLVTNENNSFLYDLYLQADGIIYPNSDASYYFAYMYNLNIIDNIEGMDTSNVTSMSYMFYETGCNSTKLNISKTIKNPNLIEYYDMFTGVATKTGSQIKINYTRETEELVDKMIAIKTDGSNVFKGDLIVDVDNLAVGDEIHISGEKFNVISQTDDTVTMLAQYNLGTDYKQSTTSNDVTFSGTNGWEYTPGPKEIDIQLYDGEVKTYVNAYVAYLQGETRDSTISGTLITLAELSNLGCTVPSDYANAPGGGACANSKNASWLVNGQLWWTRSANADDSNLVWHLFKGNLSTFSYYGSIGVRPVITISKETLKKLNS